MSKAYYGNVKSLILHHTGKGGKSVDAITKLKRKEKLRNVTIAAQDGYHLCQSCAWTDRELEDYAHAKGTDPDALDS
jgi:hypothetical protein